MSVIYRYPRSIGALLLLLGGLGHAQAAPVAIILTPVTTSLMAGQSTNFEATVRGSNVGGVTWSLMPATGTFTITGSSSALNSNLSTPVFTVTGIYKAPSIVTNPQAVTLVARSVADPSAVASATIFLGGTVGIGVTPTSVSLSPGQSASFAASIAGTLNTSVTWSLSPPVGTITDGLYTAPATVDALQTIVLTVASLADPSKTAQASITLTPSAPTSIALSPASVTLQPSQSQQFTPTVKGGTSAILWSLNPNAGTLSPSGLYTAPSTFNGLQSVAITATLASDPTKSASATVTLAGPTPPPPPLPIQLPVELIGLDGKVVTSSFNLPQSANLTGALTLSMRIHGLRYETQASVQVNNLGWQAINSSTVTLLGNATAYGGIGGGFSTIRMTMSLPAGALTAGTNTISFRFNGTDGRVSGFRVLNFNFLDSNGNTLLPEAAFVYEDPNTWQPPSSQSSDIAAGKTLWYTAPLTKPTPSGPVAIQAHCTDCHAQDGRDLKYFNYSNNSIRTRAMFHGLTAQQGDQIASYIRTLNVVNPGRPWNPPYQPGPGLDSQPVIDWAAGAGIDAVLDNDPQMVPEMFPSGIQDSVFSANGNLNIRELRIPYQLPDWNQWLPGTHPKDAFGSTFTNSSYYTGYQDLRASLKVLDPVAYAAQSSSFDQWNTASYGFTRPPTLPTPTVWTPAMIDSVYSAAQWGMVKMWEMMNEFQLEGFGQNIFKSTQADQRTWPSRQPFFTSPHFLGLPGGTPGLRNGTQTVWYYLSYIWYHLQLVLNNSNKQEGDNYPIDWGYSLNFAQAMSYLTPPSGDLQMMWLIKGLQISNNGKGPEYGPSGWKMTVNDIARLVQPEANRLIWAGADPATRVALTSGMVRAWLAQVTQFTPQQFYTGGWASPTVNPIPGGSYNGEFGDRVWYMIPRFKYLGVDPTLVAQLAQWAQTVWPNANWAADLAATCQLGPYYTSNGIVVCTQ